MSTIKGMQLCARDKTGQSVERFKVVWLGDRAFAEVGSGTTKKNWLELYDAELQAELARLKEENRWILISDRLPKKRGYINVADKNTLSVAMWYWANTNGEVERLKMFYTHWRPIVLPEQAK